MDLKSFTSAIQQIADEKGISREKIIETIEMALASAYKRDYGKRGQIVRATLEPETGKVVFRQVKIVVDETMIKSEEEIAAEEEERARQMEDTASDVKHSVSGVDSRSRHGDMDDEEETDEKKVRFNSERHIMLEEARLINPDIMPREELNFALPDQEDYGRIAAQTAKQVIIQRIREAEREAVFEEYKDKEGELVSGLVQRIEGNNVFIDIGRTVGVLPAEEQVPGERYRIGQRIKVLLTLVEKNQRGPGVFLSRTHPRLLRKLFEIEVPEIASEAVEIKSVAREPGSRSKIAVVSHESGVDPVGSLVGQKGVRVSTVIQELGGEKIDVIAWVEDPVKFIANALSPAKVIDVLINEERKEAQAMVPEDQLSLAIGKAGQNVRLAAKLTGWRIDVRSDKSSAAPVEEDTNEEESLVDMEIPPAEEIEE
ncbi:MAG: transcription termination/antitermination protein NusA [Candidatus Sungbacteria bacterium]|nr:transcription termination/antitermination protein NusA [Candidatus Sungbacteria bacterium]